MENASKALVIAGGILLAIMTLSLLVYMASSTSRIAQAQDEKKVAEQLVAFNNEYEAYNKRVMYGTDLITVVNKAIVHNEKMLASKTTDPYYINITITTKKKFTTTFEKVDNTKQETETDPEEKTWLQLPQEIQNEFNGKNDLTVTFNVGTYGLGKFQDNGESFITDRDFKNFFSGSKVDKTVITSDKKSTYKMYSALTNFKRAIFECSGVDYNDQTGRIQSMTFIQKDID